MILMFLVYPMLNEYQDLSQREILSPLPAIENQHSEDILADRQDKFGGFDPAISASSIFIIFGTRDFFSRAVSYSFPNLSLDQQALILRC